MQEVAPEPTSDLTVVLVAGGGGAERAQDPGRVPVPDGAVIVAADSGIDRARSLGLTVDHAVGDFDSVTADGFEWAISTGAEVHRHEADKDATDLELALDVALSLAPGRLVVVAGSGGRLDHELANVALLAADRLAGVQVDAFLGTAVVRVVRPGRPVTMGAEPGAVLSLLPVGGTATGITTSGVRWPLLDADLVAGTTRAVSNEVTERTVAVSCRGGAVLVVLPGDRTPIVPARTGPYDPTPRAVTAAPRSTDPPERNPS